MRPGFTDSLRSRLQKALFVSFAIVSAASLIIVFQFARRERVRDENSYFTSLSQILSNLVRHSLEISDYSDTQRMLSLISREKGVTAAVLTDEGDLLLGNYEQADMLRLSSRAGLTCDKLSAMRGDLGSAKLFCSDILGTRGGMGQKSEHIALSLIILKGAPQNFPFRQSFWVLASLLLSLFLLSWVTKHYLTRLIIVPIETLRAWVLERQSDPLDSSVVGQNFVVSELDELRTAFTKLLEAMRSESQKRQQIERELAVQNLARQVAHDIRSPLAALSAATARLDMLPEETRVLIREAGQRIHDIANNLLTATHVDKEQSPIVGGRSVVMIAPLIETIISEKRAQYLDQPGLRIDRNFDCNAMGAFGEIDPTEFKRILSNLINNSVDAMHERGTVKVGLIIIGKSIEVRVADDGPGIPKTVLSRLGQKGNTSGKSGGSGLGLYHAKTCAESWGGALEICSQAGCGTEVIIRLPQGSPPDWFLKELDISQGSFVIVLDDDCSIHSIWQGRLQNKGVTMLHFSTPIELRGWIKQNAPKAASALYLMDYELIGFKETGMSLIEELGLAAHAVLITSRYEDKEILKKCRELKVRMIPKGLAGFVPICIREVEQKSKNGTPDAVLIDDDPLVRMTWKIAAQRAGKKLLIFSTADEFSNAVGTMDRNAAIYIDHELGDGVKGDKVSARIRDLGFVNIYLATGHEAAHFPDLKHIKEIVGKDPPWVQS